MILAVGHDAYAALTPQDLLRRFSTPEQALLMDVKGFFDPAALRQAGIAYWRL